MPISAATSQLMHPTLSVANLATASLCPNIYNAFDC